MEGLISCVRCAWCLLCGMLGRGVIMTEEPDDWVAASLCLLPWFYALVPGAATAPTRKRRACQWQYRWGRLGVGEWRWMNRHASKQKDGRTKPT